MEINKYKIKEDGIAFVFAMLIVFSLITFITFLIAPLSFYFNYFLILFCLFLISSINITCEKALEKFIDPNKKPLFYFRWSKVILLFLSIFLFLAKLTNLFIFQNIDDKIMEYTYIISFIISISGIVDSIIQICLRNVLIFLRNKNLIIMMLIFSNAITILISNNDKLIDYAKIKTPKETPSNDKLANNINKTINTPMTNNSALIAQTEGNMVDNQNTWLTFANTDKEKEVKTILKNGRWVLIQEELDYSEKSFRKFYNMVNQKNLQELGYEVGTSAYNISYFKSESSIDIINFLGESPNNVKSIDFPIKSWGGQTLIYSFKTCKVKKEKTDSIIYKCGQLLNLQNSSGEPSEINEVIVKSVNNNIIIKLVSDNLNQQVIIFESGEMVSFEINKNAF